MPFILSCSAFSPIMRYQLPVQGHKDIRSAIREYVADAELCGSNQYQLPHSTTKEKVDAVKRTRFKVLPPILHLHLMRFTYDPATGNKMKVNSRFEFSEVRHCELLMS